MIESVSIASTATFGDVPEKLHGLSTFNFIFGSNGTGKTTISRIIANEHDFPDCRITWKAGRQMESIVYNRDFVERSFTQRSELKGVFTLGDTEGDVLAKIVEAKNASLKLMEQQEGLTFELQGSDGAGGKKAEVTKLESELATTCWARKTTHDRRLQGAFEGCRGSREAFKKKVLQESASNSAALLTLTEIEARAASVFGPTPSVEQSLSKVETERLIGYETDTVLTKRVIGKSDVDIAALITKLGNSDWVREGRRFYSQTECVCPFCQQDTPEDLARDLNEYFDETFLADSKHIDDLIANYRSDATRLQEHIESIIATQSRFLDVERLKAEKMLLDSRIAANVQVLARKKKEASQAVELDSLRDVVSAIEKLIDAANTGIAEHNKVVANLSQERQTLTSQVWRYVLEELREDLRVYKSKRANLDKAIAAMEQKIVAARAAIEAKNREIKELERQTTSVQPTVDGINGLLSSFGYQSFKLATTASGTSYRLVRTDGSDAKETLSEGEKTFITFLYFYHLLKGSESSSGMTTNRVVVFDDPVSSLDGDILFIVSSLIRRVMHEARDHTGHIKQVFVLTHNVYFHKEVTYNRKRSGRALNEETFWIVRKLGAISTLSNYDANPIKTSYELLWSEVRNADRLNPAIQNTLRRILESYFKILGGTNLDELCDLFEGNEKVICQSLCSWVHDGSHYAHDDLYVSIDGSMVDTYLQVFKAIFEKSKHFEHYKMMMGDSLVEEPLKASVATA